MYRDRNDWGKEDDCTETVTFYSICSGRKVNYSAHYFIPNENDKSFKSCKRFSLLSAHKENRHCEKFKRFRDVIPHPSNPPLLLSSPQLFVVDCWYVYKDFTHTCTHRRTDEHRKALIVLQ